MEKAINGKTFVEIGQAAGLLGTTIPRVLMLLKQGKLVGEMLDGEWYLDSQQLALLQGAVLPPVAPAACGSGCAGCSGC